MQQYKKTSGKVKDCNFFVCAFVNVEMQRKVCFEVEVKKKLENKGFMKNFPFSEAVQDKKSFFWRRCKTKNNGKPGIFEKFVFLKAV